MFLKYSAMLDGLYLLDDMLSGRWKDKWGTDWHYNHPWNLLYIVAATWTNLIQNRDEGEYRQSIVLNQQ